MLKKLSLIITVLILSTYFVLANKTFNLENTYNIYKQTYMSNDGRVIDKSKSDITTSEGQSYMLLRALAMNDKKTFDLVLKWSQNNLQRQDNLFAWLWGKTKHNDWGILDNNTASDADIDIALALFKASEKWN